MDTGADAGLPNSAVTGSGKAALRARLRQARAARSADSDASRRITDFAVRACAEASVVAVYLARAEEPPTAPVIAELTRRGISVLVPVLHSQPDWAWYTGPDQLRVGPRGIPQPTGERLGAAALGQAEVILLPGLAGTRSGDRLGTGGGWYDRALAHADLRAHTALLLFADEVLPDLPTDPWDRRVHELITEAGRFACLAE